MEHRRQTVWTRPLKDNARRSIADKIGRRQAKLAHLQLKRRAVGEIVSSDEDGHSRFEWLVNQGPQRGMLVYYVFDSLMPDGKELRRFAPHETQIAPWQAADRLSALSGSGTHRTRRLIDVR